MGGGTRISQPTGTAPKRADLPPSYLSPSAARVCCFLVNGPIGKSSVLEFPDNDITDCYPCPPVAESPLSEKPPPGKPTPGWNGEYVFPVDGPCRFMDTWNYQRGSRISPHHGVDIFAALGTPVCAITDGELFLLARWGSAGLTIRHAGDDGRGYEYMHLQEFDPKVLQAFGLSAQTFSQKRRAKQEGKLRVKAGQVIGKVGKSGFELSKKIPPHLHLQAFPSNGRFSFDVGLRKKMDEETHQPVLDEKTHKPVMIYDPTKDRRWNPYEFLSSLPHGLLLPGMTIAGKVPGKKEKGSPGK